MTDSEQHVNTGESPKAASLVDLVGRPRFAAQPESFPVSALIKIGVIAVLFAGMNWWQFKDLIMKWRDPNWSHGFIIPLFSLYLLYARRDELFAARRRVCVWALLLVILSIIFIILSYYPIRTYWLAQLSMVALLCSLVWYLAGGEVVRLTWLPIWFLALAMPIPNMLYERIAYPLQNLAAAVSTAVLRMAGVSIEVVASRLKIMSLGGVAHELTVAEACSGVRSLMAYLALGVAWAYLENRPIWQRVILVISAVPIAILCNVIRVTGTCSMYVFDKPEWGQGFMHEFAGLVMLGPAVVMFWGLGKLLQGLFVEEEDDEAHSRGTSTEGVKA